MVILHVPAHHRVNFKKYLLSKNILFELYFMKKRKLIKDEIYNSRVAKPSYKPELHIMTSQTELLTLKLYFFLIF